MPRQLVVVAVIALLLAGCSSDAEPVPAACFDEPATILRALARAPDAVRLAGGTRLSSCVSRARSDGDLQRLGSSLIRVADALRPQAHSDAFAAVPLGYLAGAVRSGAASSSGSIAAQLARRVERAANVEHATPAVRAALDRGLRAGERDG